MSGLRAAVILCAFACVAAPLVAQQDSTPNEQQKAPSVADAARASRANKQKAAHVYTNEDLPESPQAAAPAPQPLGIVGVAPSAYIGVAPMNNYRMPAPYGLGPAYGVLVAPQRIKITVYLDLESSASRAIMAQLPSALTGYPVDIIKADYPLRGNRWSFRAAVWAAYFDEHRSQAREDFRDWVLRNQDTLNSDNFDSSVVKFYQHDGALDVGAIFDENSPYVARAHQARNYGETSKTNAAPFFGVVCNGGDGVVRRTADSLATLLSYVRTCQTKPVPVPAR